MTSSKPVKQEKIETLDPQSVRSKAGLNLTEMANVMGMSVSGYDEWEKGTRRPGGPAYKLLFLLDNDPVDIVAQLGKLKSETGVFDV